ncbi:hypothetical protein AVI53_01840 [Piscirickettsia salmonis]|nr:hypothetical protein PSLF89_2155 [Piscirickettsia salmonis LF-89 = ATCC VR-1361]ALY02731.1 hypothetical protein AWE47_07575 [Piscirickettsia salmonis]AMA42277.1 hypothetical protein AWJ11_07760 [Piscirickettsia salmonis]AOS34752.1 hypothetical protein AVM72_04920 [Piscirickettsia salmonis]APS59464.1 hypothetical protein AVI53_01840 [Piscirickettsia salmonis]
MNILSSFLLIILFTLIFCSLFIFSYTQAFMMTLLIVAVIAGLFYLPLFFFIKYKSQLQYNTELKKRNENIQSFLHALDEYRSAFEDARFYKKSKPKQKQKNKEATAPPRHHHTPTKPENMGSRQAAAREQFYMRACNTYQSRRQRVESSRLDLERIYKKLIGFYGVEHKRIEKNLSKIKGIEANWKDWYGQWLNSINPFTRFHLDSNDLEKAKTILNDQNVYDENSENPVSKNFGSVFASLREDLQSILDNSSELK